MVAASLSLVAAAIGGSQLFGMGDTALVWANTVSMAVRALYAWRFVQRYCAARGQLALMSWCELVPPWGVLIAFIVAAICTRWSEVAYDGVKLSVIAQKGHIAVGGVCLIVCLFSWCVPRLHNRTPAVFLMIVKLRIRASPVF